MAANGLCRVSEWVLALILRCTTAWEMHLWGQRQGGHQSLWPPVGSTVLSLSLRADGRDAGGDAGSSGSGAEHPRPICRGLNRRAANPPGLCCFSQNPAFTLRASELLLVLIFYLRLFFPRLGIRDTTEKLTPMQTHEGLFTSSSFCLSAPDIAEQGLGPRDGF